MAPCTRSGARVVHPLPPSPRRDSGPDELDDAERPGSLQESVGRGCETGHRECQDESWRPRLQRIEGEHRRDSNGSECGRRVHGGIVRTLRRTLISRRPRISPENRAERLPEGNRSVAVPVTSAEADASHASRASITSAAPTTLTQPTHDLAAGAAACANARPPEHSRMGAQFQPFSTRRWCKFLNLRPKRADSRAARRRSGQSSWIVTVVMATG